MNKWEETLLHPPSAVLERFAGNGWSMAVYNRPYGRQLICEAADLTFDQDTEIPYHVHDHGYETAILMAGSAQVTLYGRRCTLDPGDLVQIESFMPHGFRFLETGSVLRILFHGMDTARIFRQRQRILEQCPAGERQEELLSGLCRLEGCKPLPEPAAELVDKKALPEVSPRGTGQEVFPLTGVTCRMRAGRWQMGGEAEIWEYSLEPGKTLTASGLPAQPTLLMVCEGCVEAALGGEVRTAEAGDLLWFPPYQTFAVTAQSGGAAVLDCRCSATLLRYLEEWESARAALNDGAAHQAALAEISLNPLLGLA